MAVECEPNRRNGTGANAREVGDVEALEPWKHGDPIRVGHHVVERHGLSVHKEEINLGMRHAESLDEILDGSRCLEAHGEADLPFRVGHEIVQSSVDSDRDLVR